MTETLVQAQDTNGSAYGVHALDLSSALVLSMPADSLLTMFEGTLSADGTVLTSSSTTVSGHPARDITVMSGCKVDDMRLFLVGNRLYVLQTRADVGMAVYPQHFFAAFRLL